MPGCSVCKSRPCATPEACNLPLIERRSYSPDYTIDGPHRARKQRAAKRARSFLITFGIVAVLFIIARLALRFFFPGVF